MKKVLCVLMLLFVLTLTSCSHIEDTNGPDDYKVTTFTDEDILQGPHSVIEELSFEKCNMNSGHLQGLYKVEKMSGIKKVAEYDYNCPIIFFTFRLDCEEGNAMVVVVANGEIMQRVEANTGSVDFRLYKDVKKTYMIYVLGESANITFTYDVLNLY